MKKKKVRFRDLKTGQKFKHKRKLFLKDNADFPVQIYNGKVYFSQEQQEIGLSSNILVTPVKVKITIL